MKVPSTVPYFSEEDIKYITERFSDILRGKSFLSMFKYAEEFEAKFAEFVQTKYAVACNSGTSALELICRAIGIEGKEVIIPSNTFVATANAVLNAGGKVVWADCTDNLCIDAKDAISKITDKTIAIMPVHLGGIVSNSVLELQKVCKEKNIHLLEDAAQAHGSSLEGIKAGSFGTAAGFSFFSTKVITTGEGGMVTTNDLELATKMKSMREFGKVPSDIYINYYTSMGYNWRMLEVSALLGLRQLASISTFIKRRQEIAKLYDSYLSDNPDIVIVRPEKNSDHNYFKYTILLPNHDRAKIHRDLESYDIHPSGYIYEIPLHKQPVFPDSNNLNLPSTEKVCATHLCLPIFYGITDDQVKFVASTLLEVLKR